MRIIQAFGYEHPPARSLRQHCHQRQLHVETARTPETRRDDRSAALREQPGRALLNWRESLGVHCSRTWGAIAKNVVSLVFVKPMVVAFIEGFGRIAADSDVCLRSQKI